MLLYCFGGVIYTDIVLSMQLLALRSEIHLHKLEEAESTLASLLKLDGALPSSLTAAKLSGMLAQSYVHFVRAQVDMALGRCDCLNLTQFSRMLGQNQVSTKSYYWFMQV